MKEIHITIGLPSSGKSTYIKKMMDKRGVLWTNLNADLIREELTGDATCQDRNREVFQIHHQRYKDYLLSEAPEHQIICIDNTSLTRKMRSQYWKFAEELGVRYNCQFYLYYFDANPARCKELQKGRERKVPDEVIDDMWGRIEMPGYNESKEFGFCKIYTIKT